MKHACSIAFQVGFLILSLSAFCAGTLAHDSTSADGYRECSFEGRDSLEPHYPSVSGCSQAAMVSGADDVHDKVFQWGPNSGCLGFSDSAHGGGKDGPSWFRFVDPPAQTGQVFYDHGCLFSGVFSRVTHQVIFRRWLDYCPPFHFPTSVDSTETGLQCIHANAPPEVSIASSFTFSEGQYDSFAMGANDPDHYPQSLSFRLSDASASLPPGLNISPTSGLIFGIPSFTASGIFHGIQIEVSDGSDVAKSTFFTILVNNTNLLPTASISASKTAILAGESVTLTGSGNDPDIDGAIVGYQWIQESGPPVSLGSSTSSTVSFTAPAVSVSGVLRFRLTVRDDDGGTGTVTKTITVSQPPTPPTASIVGGEQTVQPSVVVTLDGNATDPDSPANAITYTWTQTGGPQVDFTVNTGDPSILQFAAPDVETETELLFDLSVKDDQPASVEDARSVAHARVIVVPLQSDETQQSELCPDESEEEVVSTYDNLSNPISHANGNKYQLEVDYVGVGPMPLLFERHYNSLGSPMSSLGINWRHTYDRSIQVKGDIAKAFRPEGGIVPFFNANGSWLSVSANTTRLARLSSGGWQLTSPDDTVELYDESGKLISITNRAGFAITLEYYPNSNKLQHVTDRFGRRLSFEYYSDTGWLFKVTDPVKRDTLYGYDTQRINLTSVTYPDKTSKQYLYEDPKYAHALTGIKDGKNVQYAFFEYDPATGRAVRSYHAGGVDSTSFVFNNGTATITDALGAVRTYSTGTKNGVYRTTGGDGPKCLHCAAAIKDATFDAAGYPDTQTDFNGFVTDYQYNNRGLEERRTEGLVRDAGGQLQPTQWTRTIQTQWHATLRFPTCVVEAFRTTILDYENDGQLKTRTEVDTSNSTTFPTPQSKSCADISQRADLASLNVRRWGYTYYTSGLHTGLLKTTDGPRTDLDDTTKYNYDPVTGNLQEIINPLGHVTLFLQYDAHGRPELSKDPNGLHTRFTYDELGRVRYVRTGGAKLANDPNAFDEQTEYTYDPAAGDLDKVTLPDGSFVDYDYDDAHRLTDVKDQLGNRIHYELDGMGNRKKVEVRDPGNVLRRSHDYVFSAAGLLEESRGAAVPPQTTKYKEYDSNGALKRVEDPETKPTSYDYDAFGRTWKVYDAKNGQANPTVYQYDAQDQLLSVQDPRGNITRYTYDGLGNLLKVESPDAGTVEYTEYDAAGNLKKRIDPRASISSVANTSGKRETTYKYDALNRVERVVYDTDKTENYQYDIGVNGIGLLNTISDGTGTTTYGYDLHGRLTEKKSVVEGVTLKVGYGYTKGRLSSVTYPSGTAVRYVYVNGHVQTITVNAQNLMTGMVYDPFGPLNSWTWSNGTAISRGYDLDGQLKTYAQGGVSREVKYYPAGSVEKISDLNTGANAQIYTYDELYQLLTFDGELQGQLAAHRYEHDGVGNRTTVTLNGTGYSYTTPPENNKLQSYSGPLATTFGYDDAGNVTGDGINTYQYDDRNRLVSVNNGPVRYGLNALGQRVFKYGVPTIRPGDANADGFINAKDMDAIISMILGGPAVPGNADCTQDLKITVQDLVCVSNIARAGDQPPDTVKIHFAYDEAGQLLGEYDVKGNPIQETLWFGGMPVAVTRNNQTYFIHADHLGTPRAIIDNTNTVVWRWDSDPFGTTPPTEDPDGNGVAFKYNPRFPGQYFDQETGLHYNYFRTYDPKTGRYFETDPIGLSGGLNLFSYASGSPVSAADPFGLVALGAQNDVAINFLEEVTPISSIKEAAAVGGMEGLGMLVTEELNPFNKAKRVAKACKATAKAVTEGKTRVRHYTNRKGSSGIEQDRVIRARDNNRVYVEPASNKPMNQIEAETKYQLKSGRGRDYVETDVPNSQLEWVNNPRYGTPELTIKGDVPLDNATVTRRR